MSELHFVVYIKIATMYKRVMRRRRVADSHSGNSIKKISFYNIDFGVCP
jgi:hypothetical protein